MSWLPQQEQASSSGSSWLPKPSAPAAPVTPATPAGPKYFSAVDKTGNSFGFSDSEVDPASAKPFFSFRKPGDTSTTTDKTRVATTFDPRTPTPLTSTHLTNGRMPESVSNSIRQQLGASYNEDLDHKIALELSGSNAQENLKLIPSTLNRGPYAQKENQLAKDVVAGKISLFDAQIQDAKQKGNPVPFTGQKPGFLSQVGEVLKNAGSEVVGDVKKVGGAIKNFLAPAAKASTDTPVTQASTWLPKDETKAPPTGPIAPSIFTPNMKTANSTQAIPDASTPSTLDFTKSLVDPHADTQVGRLPFLTDKQYKDFGTIKGPKILNIPAKFILDTVSAVVEAPPRLAATIAGETANLQGKTASLPFDPTRIGLPANAKNQIQPLYQQNLDRLNELDKTRPNTPNLNLIQSFFETTANRAIFDPLITGDAAKAATNELLTWSKSSPQLGLSATELKNLAPEDAVKEVGKRFVTRANQIMEANTSADGTLSAAGKTQLSQLSEETARLGKAFSENTIPNLNPIGKLFDNAAIRLNQDVSNLGGSLSLTEGKVNPAEETLPGYQTEPQANVGLSIQKKTPVGFSADDASKNIQNKVKDFGDYDQGIKDGSIKAEDLYKDPTNKILQPEEAKKVVFDMSSDLDRVEPGLGDKFKASVDTENTTVQTLGDSAQALLKKGKSTVENSAFQTPEVLEKTPEKTILYRGSNGTSAGHGYASLDKSFADKMGAGESHQVLQGSLPPGSKVLNLTSDIAQANLSVLTADNIAKSGGSVEDIYNSYWKDGYDAIIDVGNRGETEVVLNPKNYGIFQSIKSPKTFNGFGDVSTSILGKLEGKTTVSKQFIEDLTNSPELKQAERNIVRDVLNTYPSVAVIPVKEFAEKVHDKLLPLEAKTSGSAIKPNRTADDYKFTPRYESINLPSDVRGEVTDYRERIYNSPVPTSAGGIHFGSNKRTDTASNYFGHTRVEDVPGKTRRIIEVQSDLYQKGGMNREGTPFGPVDINDQKSIDKRYEKRQVEMAKLRQYTDPTAHFRMVREEIKQAAIDGKTKLQFPTGETAMKIEGLGDSNNWTIDGMAKLKIVDLAVGQEIADGAVSWIITEVLGDGKFKAIPSDAPENHELFSGPSEFAEHIRRGKPLPKEIASDEETFDISGKVDTDNPIYRFYEKDLGRYLKRFGAKTVTDAQGVTWNEVPISKEAATKPVQAFSFKPSKYDLSIPEAQSIIRKLFDPKEVSFIVDTGGIKGGAKGSFSNNFVNLIKLAQQGGKVSSQTLFHEAFHAYFNTFIPLTERMAMITKVKKNFISGAVSKVYPDSAYPTSNAKAEEWLADDFAAYVEAQAGGAEHQSIFAKIWQKILETIRGWIRKLNKFDELYQDILSKKRTGFEEKPSSMSAAKFQEEGAMNPLDRKISEIETEKTNLEESLKNNPARALAKYANSGRELPEVLGRMKSTFGTSGDDIVTELGFKDTEAARVAYDNYKLLQKRLALMKEDLKTIKELKAKSAFEDKDAKSLKSFLDKQSKISENEIGAIVNAKKSVGRQSKFQEELRLSQQARRAHLERLLSQTYKYTPELEREQTATALDTLAGSQPETLQDHEKNNSSAPWNKIILDTNTPVKHKVGILDYFRTPDRVLRKIGLGSFNKPLRFAFESYLAEVPDHMDLIQHWAKRATEKGSNKRIFQYLDGQMNRDFFAGKTVNRLSEKELQIAEEIKTYLKDWADRLGLPADNQLSHYITHIFGLGANEKEFPEEIAKIIKDQVPGSVYDPFLEKRLGKKGYIEDTWKALEAYAKRAVRKANMDPVLERLSLAAERLEISQYNYVKSQVDKINMRPTTMENLVDNTLKQIIGYRLGQRPTAYLTRTARQWVYRAFLGLNVNSAIKNLTQGVNTYAKLGEKYTLVGYTKLLTHGTKELEDVGLLKQDLIQDKTVTATRNVLAKFDKTLFTLFELAEKINRGSAYYGAKSKAIAEGKSEMEAVEYAKKLVRDTQFQFGSIDTPVGLNSDLMKVAAQFMTFGVKQTEFAAEMLKNKEWAGIIRYIVASLAVVFTIGKIFNIKASDFIPGYSFTKFGVPPTLALPWAIIKAIANAPDDFGHPRTPVQKLKDVADEIPYPAKLQAENTYHGLKSYLDPAKDLQRSPLNAVKAAIVGTKNIPSAHPELNQAKKDQTAAAAATKNDAQTELDRLNDLPKEQAHSEFDALIQSNPDLAKRVAALKAKPSYSIEQKGFLFLGVKNGRRAQAVYAALMKLPAEERRAYYQELLDKKVVTKEVDNQIQQLLQKK